MYVATPWSWHVPMAVAAMENGVHAGVEVPCAVTLDECWRLVDVSERTRRHCMILENCCYGWNERLVLNLVRAGMLGEITHAECAYIHDLRSLLFENGARGSGDDSSTSSGTATCTRPTASGRWPSTWESTAATVSPASSR